MKKLCILLFCVLFTLTACNQSGIYSDQESSQPIEKIQDNHSKSNYPYSTINIEKFITAIITEGKLTTGDATIWDMEKETFMNEVYGAELLNTESDLYEEHRNVIMPDGNSSLQPPLYIIFEDIDDVSKTYPVYLFDSKNKLYCVNYRYVFDVSQKDQYKNIVSNILNMVTQEKETLILQSEDRVPDMDTFDLTKNKLSLKWFTVDKNQFFRLTSLEFQEHIIIDLTLSNKSTLVQ